jgi:hypothetical protein
MGSRYLLDLADVARRAGPVIEMEGWQHNARGSGGYDNGLPNHIIVHHTASPPSSDGFGDANYCCYGHPDSPVGNLYLSRTGTIYVMAGGAANTNGTGSDPCGVTPDDSMNSQSIAIEAANEGTGEEWNDVQLDVYERLVTNLCLAYGIPVGRVHSHFEWAPSRKIDPAGPARYATGGNMWDMDAFRAKVAYLMVPNTEDDEMSAATLWRPQGYLNTFLIGAGSTMQVSEAVFNSLVERGVPYVVEGHQQMLETCLFQTGLTMADMIPGGT